MLERTNSKSSDRADSRKLDCVPSISTRKKGEPLLQDVLQKKKSLMATTEKLRCLISVMKAEFKIPQHFSILGQKLDAHLEFKKQKFFNGSNFRGLWNPMTMEGPGVYTFYNGVTYRGELTDGMFEGDGVLTFPNGATIKGYWIHGIVFNPQYTFADGLKFLSKDWNYCRMPDRRFQSEILHGLRPTGNIQLSNDHPARAIPWGLLDTGEGFYDPYSNLLIHPITGESIRIMTKKEESWTLAHCRREWQCPVTFNPDYYENWFPTSNKDKEQVEDLMDWSKDKSLQKDFTGVLNLIKIKSGNHYLELFGTPEEKLRYITQMVSTIFTLQPALLSTESFNTA